jgi:integrase
MPRYKFVRESPLSKKEVFDMIDKAKETWLKAIISFLYVFGCKLNEALELKKENVKIIKKNKKLYVEVEFPTRILKINAEEHPIIAFFLKYYLNIKNTQIEKVFPYKRTYVWKKMKELNENISPQIFRKERLKELVKKHSSLFLKKWAGWKDLRPLEKYYDESLYFKELIKID